VAPESAQLDAAEALFALAKRAPGARMQVTNHLKVDGPLMRAAVQKIAPLDPRRK
jgi:hypothetical protein